MKTARIPSGIRLGLRFGAMSPRLSEQIEDQGCVADTSSIVHLQNIADAITKLVVCGYITDAVASKSRRKLGDEITKITRPCETPGQDTPS